MSQKKSVELPVALSNGSVILARIHQVDREEEVSFKDYLLADSLNSLKSLVGDIIGPLSALKCEKVTVELNMGLAIEAGKLTSLLVEGSAEAAYKVTVEFKPETELGI